MVTPRSDQLYGTNPAVGNTLGGTIRGTVSLDPDQNGELSDGMPVESAVVYLDTNFNGSRTPADHPEPRGRMEDTSSES